MFTPTKWVHHFGLFAAVGARDGGAGHGAGVAGRCCAGRATGWRSWRPCCSCSRCASPPPTAGGTCPATASRSTTRCRRSAESPSARSSSRCSRSRRCGRSCCTSRTGGGADDRVDRASPPRRFPIAAGFMVVVFVGSMLIGVVRQYPTYSNAWANLRAFTGGCGLADDVLVEPDPNDGFLTAAARRLRSAGPAGRRRADRLHPQRCAGKDCRRDDPDEPARCPAPTTTGISRPNSRRRASTARRCRCPTALTPQQVPLAGSYVRGPATAEPADLGVVSTAAAR